MAFGKKNKTAAVAADAIHQKGSKKKAERGVRRKLCLPYSRFGKGLVS